jgi:2,3-bisphosphoglycerate-independent phosphoglycerate mutase
MKYLIVVPDGAADVEGPSGEKTPLEEAYMPHITALARGGRVGLVRTIPRGVKPGSDAANLAVLGYDPAHDLTGRSPLEAVSMGIDLGARDVAFRTNVVTLENKSGKEKPDYADLTIVDHASGDISDDEARILIEAIDEKLGSGDPANGGRVKFYPGVSYRHALIVRDGGKTESGIGDVFDEYPEYALIPPHDILGRQIGLYLPGEGAEEEKEKEGYIRRLMERSYEILKDHPVNLARVARGERPANSIWIWGEGKRPTIRPIAAKYGVTGAVISAVDLIKGIGICAGLEPIHVEGATGTITTNFAGKGAAAISAYEAGKDLAYIHVEAPDECSHQGNRGEKIEALARIDADIVGPVAAYLEKHRRETGEDYRILIVPDHRTPVVIRTHTDDPVPYVIYDSVAAANGAEEETHAFTERSGATGKPLHSGKELADTFFGG